MAASRVVLHADPDHTGIRVAIFVGLFGGLLVGFWAVSRLLRAWAPAGWLDYATFLSCVGAIPVALLLIWGLERLLKRVWHSGLSILLDERGLYVDDRRDGAKPQPHDEPAMRWAANMGVLRWAFRLGGYPRGGRERFVSAKWVCLAAELQQDEARLSVYTFVPPEAAAEWITSGHNGFHVLNLAELYATSMRTRFGPPERPSLPQRLLQSKDARYWLAERRRWAHGIELAPDDFHTLLRHAARAGLPGAPGVGAAPRDEYETIN